MTKYVKRYKRTFAKLRTVIMETIRAASHDPEDVRRQFAIRNPPIDKP